MKRLITTLLLSVVASAQVNVPNTPEPKPKRPFLLLAAVDAAATLADARMTSQAQANGCVEVNTFMYGPHPSNARIYGTMFSFMAGEQFASYLLRRMHGRIWVIPMLFNAGTHAKGAIQSRVCM